MICDCKGLTCRQLSPYHFLFHRVYLSSAIRPTRKSRKLHINKVFGDPTVRGGTTLGVQMYLGDITVAHFMLVETVKHTFKESDHRMDLKLIGGDFVA